MKFLLGSELFVPEDDGRHELVTILRCAFEGRHRVSVDTDAAPVKRWLDRCLPHERAWIDEAVVNSARDFDGGGAFTVRVSSTHIASGSSVPLRLRLREAAALALAPLRLLLEDFEDDAHFLYWIGTALDNAAWRHVDKAMRNGWIAIEHGGGNTSMLRLLRALEPGRAPRWGFTTPAGVLRADRHPKRLWVMFDHDGTQPGDAARSANAQRLAEACTRFNVRHHPLRRRSIENYLPLTILNRWRSGDFEDDHVALNAMAREQRRRLYDAFAALSVDQRRHYYLRDGLRKDAREGELPATFASLALEAQGALACGFDALDKRSITRLFSDGRARVGAGALRVDGSHDEAVAILQSIVEAL